MGDFTPYLIIISVIAIIQAFQGEPYLLIAIFCAIVFGIFALSMMGD